MPFELKPYKLSTQTSNSQSSSFAKEETSLFWKEIQKCWRRKASTQTTQFNLGETKMISDPEKASDSLLEREYKRVTKGELTEAVFIPPVFISKEYERDIPTLDGHVDKTIGNNSVYLNKNFPEHWLTSQFGAFLQNGKKNSIQVWINKMKLLYLTNSSLEQPSEEVFEPDWQNSQGSLIEYSNKCIAHLNEHNPQHALINEIQSNAIDNETMKAWLTEKAKQSIEDVEINPPMVTVVFKYLFGLKYSQVVGEQAERFLFNHLQESKDLLSDFVILHSLKVFTSSSSNNKEYDFLLLSAERKLIIAIEIKQKKGQTNKARKQLKESKKLFEERLGNQLDGEWTFYPVVFIFEHFQNIQKPDHVVTSKTIGNWLHEMVAHRYSKQSNGVDEGRKQLQNVIKILVFCLHISKSSTSSTVAPGPLTTSKWVQWYQEVIETISNTDTILFYSKEQLAILYSGHPKIIVDGGYGTGKSILLREKARMLARQGEKVLFVLHPSHPKSLLQLSVEETFTSEENIIVDHFDNLIERMGKHENAHIFIDELAVQQQSTYDVINRVIQERKESKKCLWIVLHRYFVPDESSNTLFEGFKRTEKLTKCLRCSPEVLKAAVASKTTLHEVDGRVDVLGFEIFPSVMKPVIVSDEQFALQVAFEEGFLFRDGVDSTQEQEGNYLGIIYYITGDPDQSTWDKYYDELSQQCLMHDINIKAYSKHSMDLNVAEPKEYLQHLRQQNSILVVDSDVMEGFEWPIIIFDTRWAGLSDIHVANGCFRSMVTFIAINSQEMPAEIMKILRDNEETFSMKYYFEKRN